MSLIEKIVFWITESTDITKNEAKTAFLTVFRDKLDENSKKIDLLTKMIERTRAKTIGLAILFMDKT
jgi:hypothetical protein